MKATGGEQEFSQYVRDTILARGHEIQELAQPIVEEAIGESLYPVTAVSDDDVYLASPDGMTMDESTGWEAKSYNDALWKSVQAGIIPPEHQAQLAHQALVCGFDRIYFTVSDGTPERTKTLIWEPDFELIRKLAAAWHQFEIDVAAYQHVEVLPADLGGMQSALPSPIDRRRTEKDLTGRRQLVGVRRQTRPFHRVHPAKASLGSGLCRVRGGRQGTQARRGGADRCRGLGAGPDRERRDHAPGRGQDAGDQSHNGLSFTLVERGGARTPVKTRLIGLHNVSNILASALVARTADSSMREIAGAIGRLQPVPHRLETHTGPDGVTIVNDAYNSNPIGAANALDTLNEFDAGPGRHSGWCRPRTP